MADAGALLLSWLATAWLHALVLCAAAWSAERAGLLRSLPAREAAWRGALLLPLFTAAIALCADRGGLRIAVGPATSAAESTAAAPAPRLVSQTLQTTVAAPTPRAAEAAPVPVSREGARMPVAQVGDAGPAAALAAVASDPRVPLFVAIAWLALALAGGVLALARLHRLRRRLAALPAPDRALVHRAAWMARRAGLPRVSLAEDPALASPVAVAPDCIGVPAWSAQALDDAQRGAMLAHEIAHLARRDPQWRLATRAVGGLLPTPLSALARRRLDELAELQCDDWAARTTGNPRALAECLAHCLAHGRGLSTPAFAVPMAAANSPLVERVRRLIEETPMPAPAFGALRRLAIVAVLGGVAAATPHLVFGDPQPPQPPPSAPTAPAPPAPADTPFPPAPLRGTTSVVEMPFFGRTTTVSLRGGGYALDAKARGDFSFNLAEDDLSTLDGWLEIEEQHEGVTRRVRFEEGDGRIVRTFQVDGVAVADDGAARAWLGRAIPAFLRATGIDAERRTARILARGGAPAVLDEAGRIGSDWVRVTYLSVLAEQATLDAGQQDRAIALVSTMDSDYERRRALEALLAHETLAAAQQQALHGIAAAIESDYERRVLLESAIPALRNAPQVAESWIAALDQADSSYEHRVALEELAKAIDLDDAALARLLASTQRIDSDYERRLALTAAAAQAGQGEPLVAAYAQSAAGIDSDYEAREALVALVAAMQPSPANCGAVIDAVSGIDSDHEARLVLVELAARMPKDAALIERYRAAARRLGSYERGEAEQALDRLYEA